MADYKAFNRLRYVDIPMDSIRRAQIVDLGGMTMGQWYAQQADKPAYMINASLWDEQGPIGTIIRGGKTVRDQGNGFGFGIVSNGDCGFGAPWAVPWVDYITGYPALIVGGKPTDYTVDNYVQNVVTKRAAIAAAGRHLYLITGEKYNLNQFRAELASFGAHHAINLDGGGSARLMIDGMAINEPSDDRACKTCIAVWVKEQSTPTAPTAPAQGATAKGKLIGLDAGHGLYTAGKRCPKSLDPQETREWTLSSRIAGYVADKLHAAGVNTMRLDDPTGNRDVPLKERTDAANKAKCDLVVSIHHDSGINGGTGGGVTVFVHPKGSKTSFRLRDAIYENMIERTGLRGNRATPKRTEDHHMTRETKMPAALIECGFMDSKTDVPIILTDKFAQEAAEGIVRGILQTL